MRFSLRQRAIAVWERVADLPPVSHVPSWILADREKCRAAKIQDFLAVGFPRWRVCRRSQVSRARARFISRILMVFSSSSRGLEKAHGDARLRKACSKAPTRLVVRKEDAGVIF